MIHAGRIGQISRRTVLKGLAAGSAMSAFPAPLLAKERALKIGYVSPQTGPLAVFAETDNHVIASLRAALADGLEIGGKRVPVEILVRDSQSNPSRAAEVASNLIDWDEVDLMLVTATPDTTNPVGDQCELAEVPCVSTAAPWEAWYFGRGGTPAKGFDYTYHFFFGLDEAIAVYSALWKKIETNSVVAGLFPNDADGAAWANPQHGLTFHLPKRGFQLVNPGSFTNNTDNFAAHIAAFKDAGADIVTGVLSPPDWNTFWKQAHQQGFKPKIATIAKALVFPSAVNALGKAADGLTTEVVWSPFHPFRSSITGETSAALAEGWTAASGKAWTPALGWTHAIFEVGLDVLKRSADPFDREANTAALKETSIRTVLGTVDFKRGPFGRNVAVTPTVGGQWRLGGRFGQELLIVANDPVPEVPIGADLKPLPSS